MHNLPRPKKEEIQNMARSIISNEIESVIKVFSTKKSLGTDDFTDEFHKHLNKS